MMHHARLLGAAKEQEGLPCSRLRERTARQRGVEQLGAPRRGPRHVAPRGEGDAQPARVPDRHGGHLFDLGERAHHRRGAWRLQAHRGHHRPHRRVGGYHRCHEAYLQLQSVVREGTERRLSARRNRRKTDAKPTKNFASVLHLPCRPREPPPVSIGCFDSAEIH